MPGTSDRSLRARVLRRDQDEAVSPVLGTILVLAMTVIGIAAILLWGAPTVDRVQARNSALAMEGELEGLRDASHDLSVPDHSRFPTVSIPDGQLALEEGSRFLVTANHDPANPTCDLVITDWGVTSPEAVAIQAGGCALVDSTTFEVLEVSGNTASPVASSVGGGFVTATGADFREGDWLFRITDGAEPPTVHAQAWLLSSDRLAWHLQSATATRSLVLEAGAIFSRQDDAIYLVRAPPIGDSQYGAGYYGLWLRTYSATDLVSITSGNHQVFLSLASNDLVVDTPAARLLRITVDGDLAEAWCNALLDRNRHTSTGVYAADPGCTAGDAHGLRSVTFTPTTAPFTLVFLHARIYASIIP